MAEIIKLNQEYTLDGKKYTEIELDFESLTGKKLLIAESEFKKRNKGAAVKELEDGWLLTVAEKASGIKYGSLMELKGKDYIKVINAARNFIVVSDSEETTVDTGNEGNIQLKDIVTDLLEVLNMKNDFKSSLNISYETLMSCSLYELTGYWSIRAEELIQEAEMRYENSKE